MSPQIALSWRPIQRTFSRDELLTKFVLHYVRCFKSCLVCCIVLWHHMSATFNSVNWGKKNWVLSAMTRFRSPVTVKVLSRSSLKKNEPTMPPINHNKLSFFRNALVILVWHVNFIVYQQLGTISTVLHSPLASKIASKIHYQIFLSNDRSSNLIIQIETAPP